MIAGTERLPESGFDEDGESGVRVEHLALAAAFRAAGAEESSGFEDLVQAVQRIVAEQESAGAFQLALTSLTSLRVAVRNLPYHLEGRILAQQGRILRQLGDLSTAEDVYARSAKLGRHCEDPDVEVRAVIGLGVVANMRGNYPRARAFFREGLAIATQAGLAAHVAAAHQGLLVAAVAAGDSETALVHGWNAVREAEGKPDQQAEALTTLAEVAATSGEFLAALRGYLIAEQLTDLARIRLPALGGAAVAAARLSRVEAVHEIEARALSIIERSQQPYEDAQTLLELAHARALLGDRAMVRVHLSRAQSIAKERGFFEVSHRADVLSERTTAATTVTSPALSTPARRIIGYLEQLDLSRLVKTGGLSG